MNWLETVGLIHVIFYCLVGFSYLCAVLYQTAMKREFKRNLEIYQVIDGKVKREL